MSNALSLLPLSPGLPVQAGEGTAPAMGEGGALFNGLVAEAMEAEAMETGQPTAATSPDVSLMAAAPEGRPLTAAPVPATFVDMAALVPVAAYPAVEPAIAAPSVLQPVSEAVAEPAAPKEVPATMSVAPPEPEVAAESRIETPVAFRPMSNLAEEESAPPRPERPVLDISDAKLAVPSDGPAASGRATAGPPAEGELDMPAASRPNSEIPGVEPAAPTMIEAASQPPGSEQAAVADTPTATPAVFPEPKPITASEIDAPVVSHPKAEVRGIELAAPKVEPTASGSLAVELRAAVMAAVKPAANHAPEGAAKTRADRSAARDVSTEAVPEAVPADIPTPIVVAAVVAPVQAEPARVEGGQSGTPASPQRPVLAAAPAAEGTKPETADASEAVPAATATAQVRPETVAIPTPAAAPARLASPSDKAAATVRRVRAEVNGAATPQPRSAFNLKPAEAPATARVQPATAPVPASGTAPLVEAPAVAAEATVAPVVAQPAPQASATPPATGETASAMSHAAVETLTQLSVQIQKRLGDGATRFQIELKPADLGRVDVALTIAADGKVTAHVDFDSAVTAAAFTGREPELRQHLAAAGLKLDSGAVTFATRPAEAAAQPASANPNPNASPDPNGAFLANHQSGQQQRQASRQAARALARADRIAGEADLDAALTSLRNRPVASRLGLDLTV